MKRVALTLLLALPALALPASDLDFLKPQYIAFVLVRGFVRDSVTNAPIDGARVLAVWEGTTYIPTFVENNSARHCLRIDATHTRSDGSFVLTAPVLSVYRLGLAQQYVDIRIYKAGMKEQFEPGTLNRKMKLIPYVESATSNLPLPGPKQLGLEVDARMSTSKEDAPDRLRTLKDLGELRMDCKSKGGAAEVRSYFDALEAETQFVAKTPVPDFEKRDDHGMTPLMQYAAAGNVASVRRLLAEGANPNRTIHASGLTGGDSALTLAMEKYLAARIDKFPTTPTFPPVIQALLADPRTDPNLRDRPVDYTPLMKALELRQDDVVEWLLAAGADPNLTAYGDQFSALGIALKSMTITKDGKPLPEAVHQFEMLLASKRVNLDFINTYDGHTALTDMLWLGSTENVRRLLEAGANPNAPDRSKSTPILTATEAAITNAQHPQYVENLRVIAGWPGVDRTAALQRARTAGRTDLVAIIDKQAH